MMGSKYRGRKEAMFMLLRWSVRSGRRQGQYYEREHKTRLVPLEEYDRERGFRLVPIVAA